VLWFKEKEKSMGTFVVVYLGLVLLVSWYGGTKNWAGTVFLVSLIFSPFIGWVVAKILPDEIKMECPYCKERVKKEAIKCKHCGSDLVNQNKEQIKTEDAGRSVEPDKKPEMIETAKSTKRIVPTIDVAKLDEVDFTNHLKH
jgi:ribosomal protein L44E